MASFKESRGRWNRGREASGEWASEGALEVTVGSDGNRTRYHGGMCDGTWSEWVERPS